MSVPLSAQAAPAEVKPATAEEPQYVAVIELRNQAGLSAQEVSYLTELMRQAAHHLPIKRYPLITKENIFTLLPPGTRIEDCQGECAVDTGRKIGATWLMTGEVIAISGRLRVVIQLYHTPSNVMTKSQIVKGTSDDPSKRIDQIENPLLASTMRLLSPLEPSLKSKADRVEGGFVFKRVEVEALPSLPSEDIESAEQALKEVPRASQTIKSVNFQDVDVEALEAYQLAVKLEQSDTVTPRRRLEQWLKVASFKALAAEAQPHINKWRAFIKEREAIKARRARAVGKLKSLQQADAKASLERFKEREAAWAKLKRLLKLDIIERADKLSWVEAFFEAYGAVKALNPHVTDPALKGFIEDPTFQSTLKRLRAESRATLKARKERALEIERRLCDLDERTFWEGEQCFKIATRDKCVRSGKRFSGGSCLETSATCARLKLIERGGACVKSEAQLKREAEEKKKRERMLKLKEEQEAQRKREQKDKRARRLSAQRSRAASHQLRFNLTDDDQLYELSYLSSDTLKRQNISLDMPGLLGAFGASLNLTNGDSSTQVSTLGLSLRPQQKRVSVGFGLTIPLAGELSAQERVALSEAKQASGYYDRWRWEAERFTVTMPVIFQAARSAGWHLDVEFTPALALSEVGGPSAEVSEAWAALEHPTAFEPFLQTSVSLGHQLMSGGSSVGVRYQTHYSPFSRSGRAHGAWVPQLNLRHQHLGLKLEALFQTTSPSLAAFHELNQTSFRAALWFHTDAPRSRKGSELCKTLVITASAIGGVYMFVDAIYGLVTEEDYVGFATGYVGSLVGTPLMIVFAEDICS
jgi:hypothetical protein